MGKSCFWCLPTHVPFKGYSCQGYTNNYLRNIKKYLGFEIFVAINMEVIIVWDMMPMSGRNLTVRWRQHAPLKFWYIPT
jgi:hypothetical protein